MSQKRFSFKHLRDFELYGFSRVNSSPVKDNSTASFMNEMRYFITFVPGIHGFLKEGIVRVGGRSSSETLKPFGLRELTRDPNFRKNLPQHLRRAQHEVSPLSGT